MKTPDINCPRCNALQKFGEHTDEVSEGEWEIYIQCSKCKWKRVLLSGDSDIISITRQIERLKVRKSRDPRINEVIRRKRELLAKRQSNR